jgi:hypothetical protein
MQPLLSPSPIVKTAIKTGLVTALAAGLLVLGGCATTPKITTQQCEQGNWQDIGERDGMVGRSGAYFGQYIAACPTVTASSPARTAWEAGRQQGLKSYCTELTAYKLGREGYAWQPVCPLEGIQKLEEAYSQGQYYYLRQRDMSMLSSPYPWGYGRYGYAPFSPWGPRW